METWESDWFTKLGNEIMIQLVDEVDPIDPEALRLLGHDTKEKRDERMTNLKESMKATTTQVGYGNYPWNPVSLVPDIPACNIITRISSHSWSPKFPNSPTHHFLSSSKLSREKFADLEIL